MARILIVEDTDIVRNLVGTMLKNRGYEVSFAEDGEKGWRLVQSGGFDLVVLDAMMPGMTGFEVCEKIKEDEKLKGTPVIMLTGITESSGQSDKYWKKQTAADEFMSKPFDSSELVERVEKLLKTDAE